MKQQKELSPKAQNIPENQANSKDDCVCDKTQLNEEDLTKVSAGATTGGACIIPRSMYKERP